MTLPAQALATAPIPPQNLDAEESVLGAMMLNALAIGAVTESTNLSAADFYRESHGHVYRAILSLYAKGEPVDAITVVDELGKTGTLESAGGTERIHELAALVPAASNAPHYARLVSEMSTLRGLIRAGNDIARLGFDRPGETVELVDRAEQIVFDLSQQRVTTEFAHVAELLKDSFETITKLYEAGSDITGTPSGFRDLDRLTSGFQPGNLVIVAARPSMGKSALALCMASNVAVRTSTPVALFTLEMSKAEVTQRLMCAEGKVESQRLRTGKLATDDWPRLTAACDKLAKAPIYVDDTGSITMMEIRSKLRRLKSREPELGLVIVDYLQLMTSGTTVENRVQEVSQISRSLKVLARDLDVPIVALSQLSRAVEQRHDKRPILSDLRESGCLSGDSRVYLPDEGVYRPISELAGTSGFRVLAVDTDSWRLEPRIVTHAFSTGTKPVYRLTTRLGHVVRATANHKFLAFDGWRRLDDLAAGMRLAVPRTLTSAAEGAMRDAACGVIRDQLAGSRGNTNRDSIPAVAWRTLVVPALEPAGVTTRALQRRLGTAYCGSTLYRSGLSRERAALVAGIVESDELSALSTSDVYWDEVVSIEPDGVEEVYDLTVDGLHNFVAEDMVVHNSIEQDADLVMFVYRDEYYNPEDTESAGIAEVILSKHRNGATGTEKLAFQKRYAKFADLAAA
ncbi:MAG TPA: replicative DNA helicase [Gaiellaceae bacterium]|nr:replicative DNA helicase [Gaiellaceae bacterium]